MVQQMIAGRYVLQAALGRGGFGEVWQAQDTTLGRQVAVKVVDLSSIGQAPELAAIVARFRREALAVGGLRHANIVNAYDAGQAGSLLYLVMELLPGSSLADIIADRRDRKLGPLPITQILDIGTQICAGLASAHAAGVVHRDIKPGNLMVDPDGHIKIIDFGIARFIQDDMPRLTAPGFGVGTMSYVAPEQAQGLAVDGRADLYSLGCMLYELLAGQRPFVADDPYSLLYKQLGERPEPLRAQRRDVPGSLDALVAQLMEKDVAARPASAQEVFGRLTAIRQGLERQAARPVGSEAERPTVRAGDPPPSSPSGARAGQRRETELAKPVANYAETVNSAEVAPPPEVGLPPAVPVALRQPAGWSQPGTRLPRAPRRRRRQWTFAAVLLVLALVGAAIAVVLARPPGGAFTVTAVAVAPANPPAPNQCGVTVDVVGTIVTNGHGGTVTYQWTRSGGATQPVQEVTVPSGQTSAQVHLNWSFRGRGKIHVSATLRVLSPSVLSAHTTFRYSCR